MAGIADISSILNITSNAYFQHVSSLIGQTYLELLLLTVGLFIYAVFVWKFYKSISKRDLFKLDLKKYNLPYIKWRKTKKAGSAMLYVLKYLIIFPLYISFWFALLSLFLFLLAKEIAVEQIIMISVAVIATVRATAYYHEDLASDLAKLLPFALLAILFTDPLFFSFDTFYSRVLEIPFVIPLLIESFTFTIAFEWFLRILNLVKRKVGELRTSKRSISYAYTTKGVVSSK